MKRIFSAAPVLIFLLGGPVFLWAAGPLESLERSIVDQQRKVHRLSRGIEDQKAQARRAGQKETSLLGELERLDGQLLAERQKMAAMRQQITEQEELIEGKKEELATLLLARAADQVRVEKRLAAYYRLGGTGYLNVLFSSASFPDLLNLEEYFQRFFAHDRQALASYRQKLEAVDAARRELEEDMERLAAALAGLQAQERQTAAKQREKMTLLVRIKTEKKLHERAVREMEEAAAGLAATMDKLRQETPTAPLREAPAIKELPGAAPPPLGLAALKGQLQAPADGILVARFGQKITDRFGITAPATGIDIRTGAGAEVKAVYQGKIVYSGYLRGYGNLLIIDHGQQLYSLLARAARFLKQEEEPVQTGEVVGIMGDQAEALAEGLHFEIRHGSEPQDPLPWLDPASLRLAASSPESSPPDFSSLEAP